MKRVLLLIILTISVSSLFAQSLNIGIRAGLNESILDFKESPYGRTSSLLGFTAGAFADVGLGKFSIEPGLFYTTKGEKGDFYNFPTNQPGTTVSGTSKVTYHYLELPVNVLYNISTPIGKIFIGGGPYAAYGLSGYLKGQSTTTGETATPVTTVDNYNVGFGGSGIQNREYYGLGAIGGFRFKNGLSVNLGYEHSLFNKYDNSSDNPNLISFSIGYAFL